jgi:hypothetical protein
MSDDVYQTGERTTAPMQSFGMREVGIGLAVLVVGVVIAYLVPYFAA